MARSAVGVEVNSRRVHAVLLRKGRRGHIIHDYASVEHGGVITAREGVRDAEAYRRAVREVLARVGSPRENICLAAFSHDLEVREIEFPLMPEKDLAQALRFELANSMRFERGAEDEIEFDFTPLPGDQVDGKRRLLVMAAPRRVPLALLDPLYHDALYPEILEFGAFALPWVCPREGGVCYLYAGLDVTHILIYEGREYRMSRQIALDLTALLEAPGAVLAGLDNGGGESAAARAYRGLLSEVERTLEFYRARRRASDVAEVVQSVVVSGATGKSEPFIRNLARDIGIAVTAADPLVGPGDEGRFAGDEAVYAVACGMAMRGMESL